MELFAINRYQENENATPTIKPDHEDQLLQKLLRKVEKRKRALEEERAKQPKIEQQQEQEQKAIEESDEIQLPQRESPTPNAKDDLHLEQPSGFQILGEDVDTTKKLPKVEAVLPPWLSHPTIISTNISTKEDTVKVKRISYLAPHIRDSLKELKIKRLFPVQAAVIPWILNAHAKPAPFQPRDICVSAPTGSGKTLAFAVPIVQLLANRVQRKIRALVVLPVTELAQQVYHVFENLCRKTDLKVCLLNQKVAFGLEQKYLVEIYNGTYYSKVDIVVTTPGRLVDHLHSTKGFCLQSLRFLVIDEADSIMDAVFQNWLYHVDEHVRTTSNSLLAGRATPLCYRNLKADISKQPHKLLFSATLSQDPEKLQNLRLFHPKLFTSVAMPTNELRSSKLMDVVMKADEELQTDKLARGDFIGKFTTPAELTEKFCLTENRIKPLTLFSLAMDNDWQKFLCFTNSNKSSERLAYVLSKLFPQTFEVADLSALKDAKERAKVLRKFASGKIKGLICSDALARGIDIPDVDIVVSYDMPRHITTYIHRIGRTARAGRLGTAITILASTELARFHSMLAAVGKQVTQEITISTRTEEERVTAYTLALRSLRTKTEYEKDRLEWDKKRLKHLATIDRKDPEKMTMMERFQWEATKAALPKEEESKDRKRPKISKGEGRPQPRKLKPSAGKHIQLQL